MTFGDVTSKLVLEQPAKVHCGPNSDIAGNVSVSFRTAQVGITELFGPMELGVVLTGRAKTKIRVRRSNGTSTTTHIYRGRAQLVSSKVIIHQGPVRIAQGQSEAFPFVLRFPERVQDRLAVDEFDTNPGFNVDPHGPLPPSMRLDHSGFTTHSFECFVEYRIHTELRLPSIDVKTYAFGEEEGGALVYYEQPRVPLAVANQQKIRTTRQNWEMSNAFLLPEDQRPSGFKEKTKAFFKSDAYPTFACVVHIDGAANLQLGRPVKLELRIVPNTQRSTVAELPEVRLQSFSITIRACTEVRSSKGMFSSTTSNDYTKMMTMQGQASDREPFSKANDHTKIITTKPVRGVDSSFSTFNITRSYTMDIELVVEAATKTKKIEFDTIPVRVLPPAAEEDPQSNAAAAPIAAAVAGPSSTANEEVLPTYQQPPSYDE